MKKLLLALAWVPLLAACGDYVSPGHVVVVHHYGYRAPVTHVYVHHYVVHHCYRIGRRTVCT